MVDALGICADEGRARLRKALVSCHEALSARDFRMGEPTNYMLVPYTEIIQSLIGCTRYKGGT